MLTESDRQFLQQIMEMMQQGQLAEAAQRLSQRMEQAPNAEYTHMLGVVRYRQGKRQEGLDLLHKAVQQSPRSPHIHNNLANLLQAEGQLDKAEKHFKRAIKLNPQHAEAHFNLGHLFRNQRKWRRALHHFNQAAKLMPQQTELLMLQGEMHEQLQEIEQARQCYQKITAHQPVEGLFLQAQLFYRQRELKAAAQAFESILQRQPAHWQSLFYLGEIAFELHQLSKAQRFHQEVLLQQPEHAPSHNTLGSVYFLSGQYEPAEFHYREALKHAPEFAQVANNLGAVRVAQKKYDEAESFVQQALELDPQYAGAWENLASIYRDTHRYAQAQEAYQKAWKIAPRPGLRVRRALMLPGIYQSEAEMQDLRARFEQELSKLERSDLQLQDPHAEVGEVPFYLHYHPGLWVDLSERLCQFYRKACPQLNYTAPHCESPLQHDKPKIGFISRHLNHHSTGKSFHRLIEALTEDFEVHIFAYMPPHDSISKSLAEAVSAYHVLPDRLFAARTQIAQAELDIVFYPDIGMDSLSYFLSFARLAPLQLMSFAHGSSTGVDTLDLYLSAEALETPQSLDSYTEEPVALPHLFLNYDRPDYKGQTRTRTYFDLPEQTLLYGCFQSVFKLSPVMDAWWKEILLAQPEARLVLLEDRHPAATELVRERLRAAWAETDAFERLHFVPRQSPEDFLQLVGACDVLLDSWPASGGISTYDAMVTGVPLVTLTGQYPKNRFSAAILDQMKLSQWVCHSPQDYVQQAVELGQDAQRRQEYRQAILEALPLLYGRTEGVQETAALLKTRCSSE